ncbi:hypothetical protein K523DRAFT_342098 [Schizophyllum commune Tattone D]|nr:hypothetical protein K523DRAFT_342098 [Schizophyllum commune Tattone D]
MSATAAKRRANCMISDTLALDGADEDHLRHGEHHSSTSGRATSPLSRPDGGQANDCAICGWRAPRARDHAFFIQIDTGTSRVVPTNHTDPVVGTSGARRAKAQGDLEGLGDSPSTATVHVASNEPSCGELASPRLVRGRATLSTFFMHTHTDQQTTPMTGVYTDTAAGHI